MLSVLHSIYDCSEFPSHSPGGATFDAASAKLVGHLLELWPTEFLLNRPT